MDIYYMDRKTGEKKKEVVAGDRLIRWMYETKRGNGFLEMMIKKKVFSSFYGGLQDLPISKKKIKAFIKELDIDMNEAEIQDLSSYRTFNDFFVRRLKKEARIVSEAKEALISPADGRMLVYENIDIKKLIQVKGQEYSMGELIQNTELAQQYEGGVCIIVRLNPSDYHRFHFPDEGIPEAAVRIKGDYYSVNPIALRKKARIYCQNKREITLFQSENFDDILMLEVGATCVGSIIQTYISKKRVAKGEEKGYFKFGGSTVILFLKPDTVKIDEDILNYTKEGLETKVNMGERIGFGKTS
ncbi:phosphatidylserine decarboxylase [Anaerovirgula multivorans]|uniref:Phosphatidylserine decarboxylase proenzyme n=1 Tax=Anaerovirgula multivorans TaxID=312168 RepID=A0A239BRB3_9FIRM|nr:phosphatidylserine decarboxylase [Anaerovirgula multivorans]SNS10416.1 phosphatidylserine decarboxylase [Anaerovirgula multivorans]